MQIKFTEGLINPKQLVLQAFCLTVASSSCNSLQVFSLFSSLSERSLITFFFSSISSFISLFVETHCLSNLESFTIRTFLSTILLSSMLHTFKHNRGIWCQGIYHINTSYGFWSCFWSLTGESYIFLLRKAFKKWLFSFLSPVFVLGFQS